MFLSKMSTQEEWDDRYKKETIEVDVKTDPAQLELTWEPEQGSMLIYKMEDCEGACLEWDEAKGCVCKETVRSFTKKEEHECCGDLDCGCAGKNK